MDYMEKILKEKLNNWDVRQSNLEIIGLEIRRKRLELSITLQSLCFELCSPSYLCKIERNQIQANNTILNELCKRVDINDKQMEMLFHFYEILQQSVVAFVKNDVEELKNYVDQGVGFENYRYRIIQYIYFIYIDDKYKAKEIYKELIKLMENMQDTDMMIFSLFSAVLFYKEKRYRDSISILNSIDKRCLIDDAKVILLKYLFLSSNMILSHDTYYYYVECMNLLLERGYYKDIEELNYILGIFGIKTNSKFLLEKSLKILHNDIYINTLLYMKAYIDKDFDNLRELDNKELRPFAKYLKLTLDNNTNATEVIFHLSGRNDEYDFNTSLLQYLCLRDIDSKRNFILNFLNEINLVEDKYIVEYFLKEVTKLNIERPHYKETVYLHYGYYKSLEKN